MGEALGLGSGQAAALGLTDTVWLLMVVGLLVMSYTVAGGLWAVVVTDLVQLVLALAVPWPWLQLPSMPQEG